jgi:hypothetical protein
MKVGNLSLSIASRPMDDVLSNTFREQLDGRRAFFDDLSSEMAEAIQSELQWKLVPVLAKHLWQDKGSTPPTVEWGSIPTESQVKYIRRACELLDIDWDQYSGGERTK